jgi:hypothetical protein
MKLEMNLLPVVSERKKQKKHTLTKVQMVFIGLFIAVFIIYGALTCLDLHYQKEIKKVEALIENKSDYQVIYANLSQQKELLKHRSLVLEAINKGKGLPLQTVEEIHRVLPAGIKLSNYEFRDGQLSVSGEAKKKEEILEFKEKLTGLEIFLEINMVNTNTKEAVSTIKPDGEAGWEFTLSLLVAEV